VASSQAIWVTLNNTSDYWVNGQTTMMQQHLIE